MRVFVCVCEREIESMCVLLHTFLVHMIAHGLLHVSNIQINIHLPQGII